MDELPNQCQALAEELNRQRKWNLTSQQLSNLVDLVLQYLDRVAPAWIKRLKREDVPRLRALLEQSYLCHEEVLNTNAQQEWGLNAEQVTSFALQALPHVVAAFKAKGLTGDITARVRTIVLNYRAECSSVQKLLALNWHKPDPPPTTWQAFLQSVASGEYKLSEAEATTFTIAVWPHLLHSLQYYHYGSSLTTWLYNILLNYRLDGQTVEHLRTLPQEFIESLVGGYIPEKYPASRETARDWQTIGDHGVLTPDVFNLAQSVADWCCKYFPENPDVLAQRACHDIHRGLGSYYFGARLSTWINSVIRNCRKHLLKQREPEFASFDETDEQGEPKWEPIVSNETLDSDLLNAEFTEILKRRIHEACLRMHDKPTPRWKKEWIAQLRLVEGEDFKTISEIAGVSINAATLVVDRIKSHLADSPLGTDLLLCLEMTLQRLGRDQEELSPNEPARLGERLTYRAMLTNRGEIDLREVLVLVLLPLELEYSVQPPPFSKSWAVEPQTERSENWHRLPDHIHPSPIRVASPTYDQSQRAIRWQGMIKPRQRIDIIFVAQVGPEIHPPMTIILKAEMRLSGKSYSSTELPTALAAK